MNILFCLDKEFCLENGGIASVSLNLAHGFEKKGHECFFLSSCERKYGTDHRQFYLPFLVDNINDNKNKEWFHLFLIKRKIEVIINQNGTSPFSTWAHDWGCEFNIPVITVYHSPLLAMWSYHPRNPIIKEIIRCFRLQSIMDFFCHKYFKKKYGSYIKMQDKNSKILVTLSKSHIRDVMYFNGNFNIDKYQNIPNTINEGLRNDNNKEKIVLYVGRLSPEKQVQFLLMIWQKIYKKFPEWKLIIVGDGTEKNRLLRYVAVNRIEHVQFEGHQTPWEYYKKASIFCLTSAFEGFGLVLAEAMHYGVVPIAFNSFTNADEIVDNGKNGILIPPFSIDDYAYNLERLINNNSLRSELARHAVDKSKSFTIENIINQWLNLFEKLGINIS